MAEQEKVVNTQEASLNRPLQIIHSFEGLINETDGIEVMISFGRQKPPDLNDFEERVRIELGKIKERGIGGLVVNVGYDNYLEDENGWKRFIFGLRIAVGLGFRIWIYDENGYPSGTAGGKVLKGYPELEAVGLKIMKIENPVFPLTLTLPEPRAVFYAAFGIRSDASRQKIAVERESRKIIIRSEGFNLIEVYFIAPLYEGTHASRNAGSSRRYVNLLNPKAVNRFLKITHAKYFEKIPADLRRNIEAVFTDEPSLMAHVMGIPSTMFEEDAINDNLPLFPSVPWCEEIEAEFLTEHGFNMEDCIWMLFSGRGMEERKVRRTFWKTVSKIYCSSFAEQVASVCATLGMDFSGHLLGEETIYQHAVLHGNLMGALKNFHRPGVDIITCKPEDFHLHILTHKISLSASFFGAHRGLMSESSDYCEYREGDRKGASIGDIKYILAMQYLLGVRDFCFYFTWRRFTVEEYRDICDFIALMVEYGKDKMYQPDFALYYPIELVWEWYIPSNMPIMQEGFDSQPRELKYIQKVMTETCRELFLSNAQFILCDREDIGNLKKFGIKELVYPDIGEIQPELINICNEARVKLMKISDYEKSRRDEKAGFIVGENVVYACYEGFTFAVNSGRKNSFISTPCNLDIIFPSTGRSLRNVSGRIDMKPHESVFLKDKDI